MKRILPLLIFATAALADPPGPLPKTIDIQSLTAPEIRVFKANDRTIRFTAKDDDTASDLSTATITVAYYKQLQSSTITPATVAKVGGGTGGIFDATFSAADLNTDDGKYVYGVKIEDAAGSVVTWQQGDFQITASPIASSTNTASFGTSVNWGTVATYSATATDGPNRFAGAGQVTTTNADGSITVTIAAASISAVLPGEGILVATNGTTFTINFDGTQSVDLSGGTNMNGTEIRSGTVAEPRIASTIARDTELITVSAGRGVTITTTAQDRAFAVEEWTDRGDITPFDFTAASFTKDSTYRPWDLSGILPAGARRMDFHIVYSAGATGGATCLFRQAGTTNGINRTGVRSIASATQEADLSLTVDTNRFAEYSIASQYTTVNIVIKGYWY
jgi:hypothetical protein